MNIANGELEDLITDKFYSFTGKEQGAGIEGNVRTVISLLDNLKISANSYIENYPTANAQNLSKDQLKEVAASIDNFVATSLDSVKSLQSFLNVLDVQEEKYKAKQTGTSWYDKAYRRIKTAL